MEIIVEQKGISLTDEYLIYIDNELQYKAISEPLKTVAKINIYEQENKILTIRKQNFGIRANYLIEDINNNSYWFQEINNLKLIMKCQIENDLYQIYGHNGNKYSIFKNNIQVAFWEKNSFTMGEKDVYTIIANNNENSLLLVSFCICIDNSKSNFSNELSLFNFDLGFNGNLLREFDSSWKPNNN